MFMLMWKGKPVSYVDPTGRWGVLVAIVLTGATVGGGVYVFKKCEDDVFAARYQFHYDRLSKADPNNNTIDTREKEAFNNAYADCQETCPNFVSLFSKVPTVAPSTSTPPLSWSPWSILPGPVVGGVQDFIDWWYLKKGK